MKNAAAGEEYEAPVDFGDAAAHSSRGMATSTTTSVASSSLVLRTPASAPIFSADNININNEVANSSIKSDQRRASKRRGSSKLPEVVADGNNSFHSSPQLAQNNNNSTPQRIMRSSRRDLEQKLRSRSNRDRNYAASFQYRSGKIKTNNDLSNTNNDDKQNSNSSSNNNESAPLPKALTDLLLQTAILGIDTTAKLSKPTLALTKNTLLPQIILPLLTELWETYAPDRLQTWMKVLPSSLKNLHDLLWETDAGQQFGQKSLQLGEDLVDMISSEVARQYCIDLTVTLIKLMDALHTPEVRKLLDQFAVSMCRIVDVMSSGKAKQVWFDVSDTIWAALEVGSDDVMVMALAEGCAKVCFALERERDSLKRRRSIVGGDESHEVGKKSGKVKTEKLIEASRRRKERDQRQMETYPPGKDVMRNKGGRADIEDVFMDGLCSFTRDNDQHEEDNNADDDADQIYMNMSSIVDDNDRPPQRVIVPTSSMEDLPRPFTDPHTALDRDDESEITTEIEDLRRNDGNVEQGNNLLPQQSASTQIAGNQQLQEKALAYEGEQSNPLRNDTLFDDDTLDDDDQEGASERYDNFDEPVLQFYRRLNDVLTQTRKEAKMREALESNHEKRAGCATSNARKVDTSIGPSNTDIDVEQSARNDGNEVFSISKKWWKLLLVAFLCGTLMMCIFWAALGCYGFYLVFIAEAHAPMPAAQDMQQPIVIQIVSTSNQGLNNACTIETEQSDHRNIASISLDDWNGLSRDVDAAIASVEERNR